MKSELDAVGRQCGTELSSHGRDHLRHWERFLVPLRGEPFDLLEIGVGSGASLRTWREWFPAARLVGLDVRRVSLQPPITGCTITHGSQTDLTVLRRLVREFHFRLVIEDASSHPGDKLHTFLTLFPWLEPDSMYICADIAAPHRPVHGNPGSDPSSQDAAASPTWFANLGIAVSTKGALGLSPDVSPQISQVLQHATGVSLLPSSVVVTS